MKHVVNLTTQLEEIYVEAAKVLEIKVEEILELALAEYVTNLAKKEKALN
jgi:hypothetical protein